MRGKSARWIGSRDMVLVNPNGDVGTPAYDPKTHDVGFTGLSNELADKGFILSLIHI